MSNHSSEHTPNVSIGLPVYNGVTYVRSAIESLLNQTYDDFELIISDNASDDGTEQICREFAERDSRVKYHRVEENRGAIWNYNRTVELATGRFFKWAADDDLHHPDFLKRCVDLLEARPEITWCHSQTQHIDADGQVIPAVEDPNIPAEDEAHSLLSVAGDLPPQTRAASKPTARFAGILLGTTWCADSFGLIRTEALRRTRLLLACYGSEKILMGELGMLGQYAEIPEVLFFERLHERASGSLKSSSEQAGFVLGSGRRSFGSTRLKLLFGHATAIVRAPLSLGQKIRCGVTLCRYTLQFRKWGRVLSELLTRAGVGAADSTVRISTNSAKPA